MKNRLVNLYGSRRSCIYSMQTKLMHKKNYRDYKLAMAIARKDCLPSILSFIHYLLVKGILILVPG